MSNKLQKLALTRYVPGRPYTPAVPAYCVNAASVTVPARYIVLRYNVVYVNGNVRYIPVYELVPAHTVYEEVCFPAKPAQSAVPAQTSYSAITGWNSGASSLVALAGNGFVEFSVSANPFGVVVGLSGADSSVLPNEQSHAFYIHGSTVDVMEYGVVVASNVLTHASDNRYRITRSGNAVRYSVDTWSRDSSMQSAGGVSLDASLYATGDFVQDPVVEDSDDTIGTASGRIRGMTGRAGTTTYGEISGSLGPLTGSAYVPPYAVASGSVPSLTGVSADRPYAAVSGRLAAISGDADGGFPQVVVIVAAGALAPLSGVAIGKTGEIAFAEGTLGPIVGQAADYPYTSASGTLRPLTGVAYAPDPRPNHRTISSALIIGQLYRYSYPIRGRISSGLNLPSTVSGGVRQHLKISSMLLLTSSVRGKHDVAASISSPLFLDSRVYGATKLAGLNAQLATEPLQYAVAVGSNAVSRYAGFDYLQFTRVGQLLYAVRPDGLYVLGQDPEVGLPLRVDFGASTLGSNRAKTVTDAYLGVATDGNIIATADIDGKFFDYRVIQRGPIMRSRWGKGLSGRVWGVRLEAVDATYFELDAVELVLDTNNRYWTRG